MADAPQFESPVAAPAPRSDAALTLSDESSTGKTLVRAGTDSATAAELAVRFATSRSVGDVLVCGQRPEEWLLIGTADAVDALVARLDRTGHVSVVDLTHGRALFRLTGDDAPSLLEKVCGLDFGDAITPDGAVTSGSMAKVTCDIVRHDAGHRPSYRIACDRSFGQYLFDALLDAGTEFAISPG